MRDVANFVEIPKTGPDITPTGMLSGTQPGAQLTDVKTRLKEADLPIMLGSRCRR
jgi:hypothetical protein